MPRQCWARSVSECRGKASGEHLITKALFPSGLKVRGFPWCNGEVKAVGANALTAKVLCRYHNTELSELDSAALDVWCVLREIGNQVVELQTVARIARIQPRAELRKYPLDGARLERWCFKMTINMVASGSVTGFPEEWEPRKELVDFVFGAGRLPDGCGLGLAVVLGEKLEDPDNISFQLIRRTGPADEPPEVEGFLIGFRGLRFAGSSTRPLLSLHTPVSPLNPEQVLLRPKHVEFLPVGKVDFDWSGRDRGDDNLNVVRARKAWQKR